jgi:hypothetical protein
MVNTGSANQAVPCSFVPCVSLQTCSQGIMDVGVTD